MTVYMLCTLYSNVKMFYDVKRKPVDVTLTYRKTGYKNAEDMYDVFSLNTKKNLKKLTE